MEPMPESYVEAFPSHDEPGEETAEVSSTESPPATPIDKEDFERRVSKLCQMMEDDPSVRDRLLAEIYVNMASAEMGIRGMFEMVQKQGIAGMMRGAFRRE